MRSQERLQERTNKEIGYEIVQLSEYVMPGKAFYRRITSESIGPGGWRCACCAPAPGAAKRMWKKIGMRKSNRLFSALVADELKELRESAMDGGKDHAW